MNRMLASLKPFLVALGLIALPLLLLFREGFSAPKVLRANDTPFGLLNAQADTAHEAFTGHWRNLNWLGRQEIEALPVPTQAAFFGLGSPEAYAKWHAPLGLLFLGLSRGRCFLGGRLVAVDRHLGDHLDVLTTAARAEQRAREGEHGDAGSRQFSWPHASPPAVAAASA